MGSTIVSALPFDLAESKPSYREKFIIKGVGDGEEDFALTLIEDTTYTLIVDQYSENIEIPVSSQEVAEALCRDYVGALLGATERVYPCLFMIPEELTEVDIMNNHKELLDRKMKQHSEWLKHVVRTADADWGKFKSQMLVSELQKFAARKLGLEREWMNTYNAGQNCPACFAPYFVGQALCRECKCVLDPEKIASLTFASGASTIAAPVQ